MRAFLMACAAAILLAVVAVVGLSLVQKSSGSAYATEGARINPSWSWRNIMLKKAVPAGGSMAAPAAQAGLAEECDVGTTLRWIMIDFGDAAQESPDC